jgi:type VI secretion system secreted protein Hcp
MKEVFITAVSPSGGHGGEIIENVACTYKDIEFDYKAQDDKGVSAGQVKFGWNVATTETR